MTIQTADMFRKSNRQTKRTRLAVGVSRLLLLTTIFMSVVGMITPMANASEGTFAAGQTWLGSYECREQKINFELEFRSAVRSDFDQAGEVSHELEAVFNFSDGTVNGSFLVKGKYEEGKPLVRLEASSWIKQPKLYRMVGLWGTPLKNGTEVKGRVLGGFRCSGFTMNLDSTVAVISEPKKAVSASQEPSTPRSKPSIDRPDGIWTGLARCKGRVTPIRLVVKRVSDRFAARLLEPSRLDFYLVPKGKGQYEFKDQPRSLNRTTQISETELFGESLSISSLAGCMNVRAARFTPIQGLGGKYAEVSDQDAFCSSVVSGWLSGGRRSLKKAKKLMVDDLPMGSGFNPERSAMQDLLGGALLEEYFGSRLALTKPVKQRLRQQIGGCALTDPSKLPETWTLLFQKNELLRARAGVSVLKALPEELPITTAFQRFIAEDGADLADTSPTAYLEGWESLEAGGASVAAYEAYLKRHAKQLSNFPPSRVSEAIAPLIAAMNRQRGLDNALADKAKRSKYQQLLGDLNLPLASLNPRLASMLDSLSTGGNVSITSDDLLYFGGLAGYMLDSCPSAQSVEERIYLANFVGQAAQRAGMGDNYSDKDLSRNLGSALAGQAKFSSGAAAGRSIGCSNASPILSVISDMTDVMKVDESGRESLFVRSCSVDFDVTACRCLADVGFSVYPDIYSRRYSGSIINGIVRRDPIAGIQVLARCGINNY